ncbi:MAG TPA: transposase, partial [Cyclobacteriaceae bacterium]
FKTLYPDTLACYRFLENLKWQNTFRCRKCENEKFFDGAHKFSRRCTRCGYNESITAYTIFHSIKFPIEKAFYIAYLAVLGNKDKDHTLEKMAEELELRVNTLWSFKHKVTERISDLEKKGHKPHASRWEEVIMLPDVHKTSVKKQSSKLRKPIDN